MKNKARGEHHPPKDAVPIIDTSSMSEGKRAAVELTESSRDALWQYPTFVGEIFMGRIPWELVYPYPEQSLEDRMEGDRFLIQLERYLRDKTDPEAIDNDGEIPKEVFEGLAALGAFGIKIPRKFGGLGLSQTDYGRVAI